MRWLSRAATQGRPYGIPADWRWQCRGDPCGRPQKAPLKGELAAVGRLRGLLKSPQRICRAGVNSAAVLNPSAPFGGTSPVRGGFRAARFSGLKSI